MNKKPMIIVGAFFALIVIALTVYLILSLTTDIFKPKNEIFLKYLKNSTEMINQCINVSKEEEYINTLKQNNYTDNSKAELNYTKSSDKVENFIITSNGITNNSEKKSYRTINIKYGKDYDIINAEYLQENQTYGLLFSNVVKKFIAADIDNFENFLNLVGIDANEIKKYDISETINFITNDKEKIEKTIIDYITKINNGRFRKQTSNQVTLNNGDIQIATAYSLELSSEQTKELYLEVLKSLSQQEEINGINNSKIRFPELNLVFYVLNDEVIRATFETDKDQVRIDFYKNQLNIKYNKITEQELKTINLDIKKEEQNTLINYQDSYNNKINVEYNINNDINTGRANLKLSFQNDYIKNVDIDFEQNMEFSNSTIEGIQKKLENPLVINISKLKSTDVNSALNSWLNRIDNVLLNKNNQINSEIIDLWVKLNKTLEDSYNGNKEKQKNTFNNQFLVYQGNKVEKQIIYNLLDLAGINMEKYEETEEDIFKVSISQGTKNVKLAEEIKKKIESSSKVFSVTFGYDSEGKVNSLVIRGYEENN